MTTATINARDFVAAWMTSLSAGESLEVVAGKVGIDAKTCSAYAGKLRRMGVNLPVFPRGRKGIGPVDVAGLNAMIGGPSAPVVASIEEMTVASLKGKGKNK